MILYRLGACNSPPARELSKAAYQCAPSHQISSNQFHSPAFPYCKSPQVQSLYGKIRKFMELLVKLGQFEIMSHDVFKNGLELEVTLFTNNPNYSLSYDVPIKSPTPKSCFEPVQFVPWTRPSPRESQQFQISLAE